MPAYREQLKAYSKGVIGKYHTVARQALQVVFPDAMVLSTAERQHVVDRIAHDASIATMIDDIAAYLKEATGTDIAVNLWRETFESKVEYLGGQPISDEDKNLIKSMLGEVQAFLVPRYSNLPIKLTDLFPHISISVNSTPNANTVYPGDIHIGLGTRRSKAEYYSWLIHELRHAVAYAEQATEMDKSAVAYDEGIVLEGSGVAVESLLLQPFLQSIMGQDGRDKLYALAYGIRDARFLGTTEATLAKYFRVDCERLNAIEFSEKVAERWGLKGQLAQTVAQRANAGTQYLQYILGGIYMLNSLKRLQSEIAPSENHVIDPYTLFACGLNTPRETEAYRGKLEQCLRSRQN